MIEFQKKRKIRKFIYSKWMAMFFLVLIIIISRANWNIYKKNQESKYYLGIASKELGDLEKRNTQLNKEIETFKTQRGIEEEIRGKYQVVKEGELVTVIIDSQNSKMASVNNIKNNQNSFFQKIILWIENVF